MVRGATCVAYPLLSNLLSNCTALCPSLLSNLLSNCTASCPSLLSSLLNNCASAWTLETALQSGVSHVMPRAFKERIGRFAPQFSGYAQHDSQVGWVGCRTDG